ncbi:MAG TPA: hypothetical protein VGQ62_19385, partial [Chloroflexota bacterium]|nr:hypothetical protein [Chloroflexota bacterium]
MLQQTPAGPLGLLRSRRGFLHLGAVSMVITLGAACAAPAATPTAVPPKPTDVPKPAAAAPTTAPVVATIQNITLRQIGTGVSAINEIRDQAQKDLGFQINMRALSTDENNQIAITQPKQYDIFDGEYFSLPLVIPSGNLQPLDTKKIKEFDKIVGTFVNGKLAPDSKIAQGTAPHKVMFLQAQDSTRFATEPTQWANLIPTQYNADTLGYRPDLIGRKIESWAELFN